MRGTKDALALIVAYVSLISFVSFISIASPAAFQDSSPQGIIKARVKLYFDAAGQPLDRLAPAINRFATDSERCRMLSGAKACGLPSDPLKSSRLKQVFRYYVSGPVEAGLARQKVAVHKSAWTWQPHPTSRH